ncbi:MAG: GRP family sugar transporter [Armatimonadia bacterium]
MDWYGYGLAFAALVLFGLYMVPRKLTTLRDLPFVLSMCVGVVVSTTLTSLLIHGVPLVFDPRLHLPVALAFLCGPIWYLGVLFYTMSVTEMGLALATPIKNTTAVLGTVIGLAYFGEWRETRPLPALAGAVFVMVCAVIIGRTGENDARRSNITARGIIAALAAAVFFAMYTAPFKLAQQGGLDTVTLVAYMGLGTLAGAIAAFAVVDRDWRGWVRTRFSDHLYAALCGVLWVAAVIVMAEAIRRIGLAIVWPFTNLNTIVTVACGIIIFREISVRKFGKTIAIGLLVGVVGVVFLGVARL